jgi:hypothetical protein
MDLVFPKASDLTAVLLAWVLILAENLSPDYLKNIFSICDADVKH